MFIAAILRILISLMYILFSLTRPVNAMTLNGGWLKTLIPLPLRLKNSYHQFKKSPLLLHETITANRIFPPHVWSQEDANYIAELFTPCTTAYLTLIVVGLNYSLV